MTQSVRIGIDIGGTHIRLGVIQGGELIRRHQEPVGKNRIPRTLAAHLKQLSHGLLAPGETIEHVGIGLPGIINKAQKIVVRSPHFPEWVGVPFAAILQESFGLPVHVDNDANMALIGESQFGVAKEMNDAVMVTLGTGIGGAIMVNRKLVYGTQGFTGEIGHMVIDRNGAACPCGGRGCWELYASAQAFRSPPHLVTAEEEWIRFGQHLGIGLASLANILGINDMIIGGGLANAWEKFAPTMTKTIPQFTYPETAAQLHIHKAALGESAALIGAGL